MPCDCWLCVRECEGKCNHGFTIFLNTSEFDSVCPQCGEPIHVKMEITERQILTEVTN